MEFPVLLDLELNVHGWSWFDAFLIKQSISSLTTSNIDERATQKAGLDNSIKSILSLSTRHCNHHVVVAGGPGLVRNPRPNR